MPAYPQAHICDLDSNSNFVAFAHKNIPGVEFLKGNTATSNNGTPMSTSPWLSEVKNRYKVSLTG